ncbi:MAG: hypothetical protein K0U47_12630 [Epsilonproteobacteria bacterium]|nr:hypothetical protein [Campylobacterota bacterium]
MDILFDNWKEALLVGGLTVLLFILAPLAIGHTISRFLIKIAIVGLVLYFSNKLIDWLTSLLINIIPNDQLFLALSCQLGIIDGLNLFFKIIVTVYMYKLLIRVMINS